ncbi:hypothetical protein CJO92_19745 (plasmid) [Ralstonia solanacearum]|uniref:Uncharacterized protein n=1 Tax=Ralstonia solanacearum TaxID=305 RepID=A0AAD0SB80_RALSL|nr:hypothetical protein CJO77_19740 [Ralstonia solanacearum]AXW54934.1 hypothetical protein CJO92_19745 [Ralstonia solanacearum]
MCVLIRAESSAIGPPQIDSFSVAIRLEISNVLFNLPATLRQIFLGIRAKKFRFFSVQAFVFLLTF